MASQAYGACNEGWLPPAILYFQRGASLRTVAWDFEQQAGATKPGSLWKFSDHPEQVQQCPCCAVPSTFGADPATGYHYNTTYLGAEGTLPEEGADGRAIDGWKRARAGLGPGQWRRPSDTAVFADGGWKGGANKFMRAPSATVERDLGMVYAGGSAFRHRGQCNVAWLDGHVDVAGEAFAGPHATPQLLKAPLDWPNNGFLSFDDRSYDPR
jgi:prepilin-type processing-associated H-X9-DG protein